jgi:hypothetical protein
MSRTPPPPLRLGASGPGPGAGADRDPERTSIVVTRIALVATIVVGQLWALAVALNAYFLEQMTTVRWLMAFQAISFLLSLAIWWMAPRDR